MTSAIEATPKQQFIPADLAAEKMNIARLNIDYLIYMRNLATKDLVLAEQIFRRVPRPVLEKLRDAPYSMLTAIAVAMSVWPVLESGISGTTWTLMEGVLDRATAPEDLALYVLNTGFK